jgi:S-adenosylmethionine hydrolase
MRKLPFSRTAAPIVLLTDFGFRDSYVGVMKGVIRKTCPDADVIDLSHNIMPQDVAEAAFVLAGAYAYFPEETVFVNVVDPGVGSDRKIVCMRANKQAFLAPDNGLLSIVANETGADRFYEVSNSHYFLPKVSGTFHGRDIFAPVAAHIASGVPLSELGPRLSAVQQLKLRRPVYGTDGILRGEIVYVDHFGNLTTNISEQMLQATFRRSLGEMEVSVADTVIKGVRRAYADVEQGQLLALIGSSGYLEVAVNGGSAEKLLRCEKGDSVNLAAQSP